MTETGIDGLACGMIGGSSFQEEKSKEAFTLMTNETDLPIEVAPELADVRGDIEIVEDRCQVFKPDEAGIFTAQEINLRDSRPSSVDIEETSLEHEKMGIQIEDWISQIEWIPITKTPVVIFLAGIGGTTCGFQMANEIYGTTFRFTAS